MKFGEDKNMIYLRMEFVSNNVQKTATRAITQEEFDGMNKHLFVNGFAAYDAGLLYDAVKQAMEKDGKIE